MTAQPDPYVRVYYRIIDDPKFERVYDNDAALAAWLRLLLAADAMYPAPAHIPRSIKPAALGILSDVELIDLLPGDRFRLHGLRDEREKRSNQARDAAFERWERAKRNAQPNANGKPPQSVSNAGASEPALHSEPSRAEQLQAAPRLPGGEEMDESMKDGADAYFSVTGRFPSDPLLAWINRLTQLYGDELFAKLLSKCYLEDANPRTLMGRVEERCKAIYHRQHRDELQAESQAVERAMSADVARQQDADWDACGSDHCTMVRRQHPGLAGHTFVEQAA